jgi:hypothetical protein
MPRRLDKALFQQLATCRWIAAILIGIDRNG